MLRLVKSNFLLTVLAGFHLHRVEIPQNPCLMVIRKIRYFSFPCFCWHWDCVILEEGMVYGRYENLEEITVSFVRDSKPLGLFRYLEENRYAVTCHSHGIYYVEGNVPFLVQIVVTKELDKHAHAWLRALSSNLQKEDALRVLYKIPGLDGAFEREMADSVLAVMAKANGSLVDGLRGENGMYYETLFKILEPNLPMLMEKSIKNGENDVYEALFTALEPKFPMLLETVRNEDIQRTISVLRDFGHYDKDIRAAIMDKYSLTPAKADELLNTPPATSK